ncbi:glycoside hydrolase family 43 protein [Krasilnikoviella flava]|uniref:Arabinan endo-1,5-alpha-L-arabinosidase n=1 Tax=Krasilnikoviella flava TaxID=526729 RepID=A0A1T5JGJ5_9MICO|nr:glycoside hydrolase family 43 protein [Krasilnikoviella flava]SKC50466.1 arabinan endo-1,5-alpha-L-arabinosidase [Krasilnikoviella flava]
MHRSLRRVRTAAAGALTAALLATSLVAATTVGPAFGAAERARPVTAPVGGLSVTGETSPVHDPALVVGDDGTWRVYTTGLVNRENGGTIQMWSSHDEGVTWAYDGTVWDEIPAWIDERFAGPDGAGVLPDNLWAPEVYEHDGTYYLYYSASRFGTNTSVTALATNTTLDPDDPDYAWVDQGPVISSPHDIAGGKTFNAIDAGIVEGADGTPYMAIGSYWYGIFLVELEWPGGKLADGALENATHLVDRKMPGNPVEAPYITERDGWYYLFVSFDACCRGLDSTYQVAVGRSRDVAGPYLDQDGKDLADGGGTVLLSSHGAVVGPGGQSVSDGVLAFHFYDGANAEIPGFPTLGLQRLDWEDGWPVVDQTVEEPVVTQGPRDATVRGNRPATFEVRVSGTPAPVVTWEVSDDDGATWTAAPVAAARAVDGTASWTVKHAGRDRDGLLVRAVVANAHGAVRSEPARLDVLRPGGPAR